MRLILVESPTKSNTIKKFLGKDYEVAATFGHIRDLPEGNFGIDLKNNFKPEYVIPAKAKKTIASLKKLAKTAESVILAVDEDREGEAIAWHLTKALGLKKYQRIAFHEITKPAIEEALKNPREIDMNLVNAQQTRRILDRIVGYKLSPFLWKKIAWGLSAGRVQSVAVRLIVEREREIKSFIPQEYWQIKALLEKLNLKGSEFEAFLAKKNDKAVSKLEIKTENEASEIVKDLEGADYRVIDIERKETRKSPLPPFTTSTLQQEAWRRFHFSAKMTMRLAQQLYERGLCSYHRTDSFNLSEISLAAAKEYILKNLGKEYWPGFSRKYKTKSKSAQEAHEAIRPTDPFRDPPSVALSPTRHSRFGDGTAKEGFAEAAFKLYALIWQRFLACQMSEAIFDSTIVDILAEKPKSSTVYALRATGQTMKFAGFLKVYPLKFEEINLPYLEKNESLKLIKVSPSQHFTQPPNRYSEATLVKALEKFGIGRPSTYAPTLETIQTRGYVQKDEKKLFFPADIGFLVNDLLVNHFPKIVDVAFTAKMEEELDQVSSGKKEWLPVIEEFYIPFKENLKTKEKEVSKEDLLKEFSKEEIKETCPLCQSLLNVKFSRYGKFYACSKFPECKYKKNLLVSLGIKCPKCQQAEIVERKTRKQKRFYGCSRWPDCDFALWDKPTGQNCPACDSLMVKTRWRKEKCSNKDCKTNSYGDAKTDS
ncbi:MAG: type I DNA topoisomerase [bacterium]|nr:type I DNA topoisomerase [bacterium]